VELFYLTPNICLHRFLVERIDNILELDFESLLTSAVATLAIAVPIQLEVAVEVGVQIGLVWFLG
jgi:hypothetical protein